MIKSLLQYRTRIPEIYGSFVALGLIAYFLISWWMGFIDVIELRLLNFPILGIGVYYALRHYSLTHTDLNYFRALAIGVATSAIGTSTFVVFLFVVFKLDPQLYQTVVKDAPLGSYMNAYIATFAVMLEGIFSGFMATFILINFIITEKNY